LIFYPHILGRYGGTLLANKSYGGLIASYVQQFQSAAPSRSVSAPLLSIEEIEKDNIEEDNTKEDNTKEASQ
jgi:hypothetical protein